MTGRFSAAKVSSGPDKSPLKSIILGPPGVGKTWFVSTIIDGEGSPIFFLPVEEGAKGMCPDASPMGFRDRDRWMTPTTLSDFFDACDAFMRDVNASVDMPGGGGKRRPFRHFGVDGLTGLERMVHEAACGSEQARHMEDKDYKKVWNAAVPMWESVQAKLDEIRRSGVNVWLIAHATETYDASQTSGEVFRKWDIMLRGSGKTLDEARHLWRGWADNVWFITKDITVSKGDKAKRAMARLGGRLLITRETGSVYAKSRLPIPERIAATWPDLQRAIKAGTPVKLDRAREQLAAVLGQLSDEDRATIEAAVSPTMTPTQVAAALSRAQGMLAADRDGSEAEDGEEGASAGPKPQGAPLDAGANDAGPQP